MGPAVAPFAAPEARQRAARLAGLCYLVIIICGVGGEVALRAPLVTPGDAAATAEAIRGAEGLWRLSMAADAAMAVADVALGVLLAALFWTFAPVIAAMAMAFRLVQAAILGLNLGELNGALLWLETGDALAEVAALQAIARHAAGYDLGLVFFGVNCLLTGWLIWRSGYLPRGIGAAVAVSGLVYLAGSGARFLAPEAMDYVAPAYAIPFLAESAMCLWLLLFGMRPAAPAV
jgi:hypothetical protein